MLIEDMIKREEFATKTLTYEQFCDLGNRIIKGCVEEALKALPQVVTSLAHQAAYLKSLSDEFYTKHPDLAKNKEIVARTIERIEADNPGMDYKQILEQAVPKARQTLTLKNQFKES